MSTLTQSPTRTCTLHDVFPSHFAKPNSLSDERAPGRESWVVVTTQKEVKAKAGGEEDATKSDDDEDTLRGPSSWPVPWALRVSTAL